MVVVDGCGPDAVELLLVEVDDEIIIMRRSCEVRVGTPRFFTTLKPVAPPIIIARGRGGKKLALAGGGDETCSGHDDLELLNLEKTRFVAEKIILSDTAMYKGIDNNKCPSTRCNDCRFLSCYVMRSSVFQRE